MAFCASPPKGLKPPLTLRYDECLANPIDTAKRIYEHSGRELSSATERAMRAHTGKETQHQLGRPSYSLAKFGLEAASLRERFHSYRVLCGNAPDSQRAVPPPYPLGEPSGGAAAPSELLRS